MCISLDNSLNTFHCYKNRLLFFFQTIRVNSWRLEIKKIFPQKIYDTELNFLINCYIIIIIIIYRYIRNLIQINLYIGQNFDSPR